ncbi:MAG: MBL fold metallo-hydrolase [Pseudomonadales bacterium]
MTRWLLLAAALLGLLFWAYADRRELFMRGMQLSRSGAVPPLLPPEPENAGTRWVDDYFLIEQVAADTWAIGEPRYAQMNFNYLIVGSQRALLFDAGPGVRDVRAVAESLTDRPIVFLPSHFHYDHVGNGISFSEIAVVDLPYVRARARGDALTLTPMEHLGAAEGFDPPTWKVSHWWAPGTEIDLGGRSLWLLYTPGHTTDSVSLWDRSNGLVFSGDYLYPGNLYAFLPNSSVGDYARTAASLLRELPASTHFLGAHRLAAPGPPTLQWQDLLDLRDGLEGVRRREIPGTGTYPQSFPINEHLTLLAEPRWLQNWD